MQIEINSPILKSISAVYEERENLFKQSDTLKKIESDLSVISTFFGLDNKPAALLAVIICDQLMGESNSINRIMRTLGFVPVDFIQLTNSIKDLRKAGWIRFSNKGRRRGNSNGYEIANEVIEAVLKNAPHKLRIAIPDNLRDTLMVIRRIIKETTDYFSNSHLDTEELLSEIDRFSFFPFIDKLLNNTDLTDIEKITLFWFSAEILNGRDDFDLISTLEAITGDGTEVNSLIREIKSEKTAIMRDGYIRFVNQCLADFSSVTLGDRILDDIGQDIPKKGSTKFVSKYCLLIVPTEIQEKVLFFNPDNEISVNEIMEFTAPESFSNMEKRFTASGLKPGLTMLFYGLPGTGKTELVRQIAKLHQRVILQVEISAIKNMWVGESEKNLKKVFLEYQAALKHYENTPILFFNEADGILGERRQTQHAVDQMLNTMQNILLQELEDFQGIFIATTNLIVNIDRAFDRRMLYKLNFQTPNEETRFNILKKEFPDIAEPLLNQISMKHTLSGGQIQNIKKKFLVDTLLFAETSDYAMRLLRHVEEETQFRTRKGKTIGFKLHE
ncbi:MAG: ATP-binding protein [Bacteroidota bacterium]